MGSLRNPCEYAGRHERSCARLRRAARAGRRRRDPDHDLGRDQHPHPARPHHPADTRGRRPRAGCAGGRADEPVSARHGPCEAAARRGDPGVHRRLSRERRDRDAAGSPARARRGDGPRHHAFCGRGRTQARRPAARSLAERAEAALQLHEGPSGHGRRADAVPARRRGAQNGQHAHELRRRARMPVPLQLLHDHQRPGAQVAFAHRRRRRAPGARQSRAGRAQLLHHRRQPRAQPELGADIRPPHQNARRGRPDHQDRGAGRHRRAQDPRLHREGRRAPASTACSSGWRTSTRSR